MKKLTPKSFREWVINHDLTIAQCAEVLDYAHKDGKSQTITRLKNGSWVGWLSKSKISVLEFKMKKYEESLK